MALKDMVLEATNDLIIDFHTHLIQCEVDLYLFGKLAIGDITIEAKDYLESCGPYVPVGVVGAPVGALLRASPFKS